MPSVPLPFVVAILLLILLGVLVRRREATPADRPFLALIGACAGQSLLLGLRWGYGIEPIRYVAPVLAAAIPALVYASFRTLAAGSMPWRPAVIWPYLVPMVLVAVLVALWRAAVDAALIAIYLGYAAALIRLARSGPDALGQARFEGTMPAHRALQLSALALMGSASVDGLVLLDFEWTRGAQAALIVAIANLLGLLVLALAASIAGRSQPSAEAVEATEDAPAADVQEEDRAVVARIEDLMRTQRLFRDENLNLDRLARKAGIPARQISGAINRLTAKNVSQYVNDYRIAAACRLLEESGQPVTVIMLEVGFQTKSNFNREFRRVTGTSPSLWRARQGKARDETPSRASRRAG
jgi:AraC-like DNA-binding protein